MSELAAAVQARSVPAGPVTGERGGTKWRAGEMEAENDMVETGDRDSWIESTARGKEAERERGNKWFPDWVESG